MSENFIPGAVSLQVEDNMEAFASMGQVALLATFPVEFDGQNAAEFDRQFVRRPESGVFAAVSATPQFIEDEPEVWDLVSYDDLPYEIPCGNSQAGFDAIDF